MLKIENYQHNNGLLDKIFFLFTRVAALWGHGCTGAWFMTYPSEVPILVLIYILIEQMR